MLVERFHALQDDIAPLLGFVGISFTFHEYIEQARAAGFQTDDRISHAAIAIGRFFVLHMRERNNQRSQTFNDGRIRHDRRHRDVRHLQCIDARHALHHVQHFFQRRHIRFKIRQLLVEKHVLCREHDLGGAFPGIDPRALENVFEWK